MLSACDGLTPTPERLPASATRNRLRAESENQLQSCFCLRQHNMGNPPDALRKKPPVQGDDLRDVDYGLLGQAGSVPGEANVAESGRQIEVCRDGKRDDGPNLAPIGVLG